MQLLVYTACTLALSDERKQQHVYLTGRHYESELPIKEQTVFSMNIRSVRGACSEGNTDVRCKTQTLAD